MRKKLLLILAIMMLIVTTAACGSKVDTEQEAEMNEGEYEEMEAAAEEEGYAELTADLNWKEFTIPYKDSQGYTYDLHYKISPWILLSGNHELAQAAWYEVSSGEAFPEDYEWPTNGNNDFYYCIGNVEVINTTDGWDITGSNSRSFEHWLKLFARGIIIVGRTYYPSGVSEIASGVMIEPNMTSNEWGPVPFIIAYGETFSPNDPNGQMFESLKDSYFVCQGETIAVNQAGIIDKNGKFIAPGKPDLSYMKGIDYIG